MRELKNYLFLSTILVLSLVNLGLGWFTSTPLYTGVGATGLCYLFLRLTIGRGTARAEEDSRAKPSGAARPAPRAPTPTRVDPNDTRGLVEQMLAQGRFALLLRAQIARSLGRKDFGQALQALQEAMALVPDGEVVLGKIDEALDDGRLSDAEIAATRGRTIHVDAFFLDRYPVTNREFYEFVAAGGYEQMALWERQIWPAILHMVDRTGSPGPAYWENGCFRPGEEKRPVVGVSWYEANAYARWVGKRLSTDAEWVKAGSWPVALSSTTRMQRRYPWGETMDRTRANLCGSGPERIVAVDEFSEGVSVGGVYQLIGNVWEWTGGSFRPPYHAPGELLLSTPMKSIRGGAFDTYFDNQSTCQFSSGENPLRRRHNIGFRCAVGVCDLSLAFPTAAQGEPAAEHAAAEQPAADAQVVPAEEVCP